jgi:hypothetical protein
MKDATPRDDDGFDRTMEHLMLIGTIVLIIVLSIWKG